MIGFILRLLTFGMCGFLWSLAFPLVASPADGYSIFWMIGVVQLSLNFSVNFYNEVHKEVSEERHREALEGDKEEVAIQVPTLLSFYWMPFMRPGKVIWWSVGMFVRACLPIALGIGTIKTGMLPQHLALYLWMAFDVVISIFFPVTRVRKVRSLFRAAKLTAGIGFCVMILVSALFMWSFRYRLVFYGEYEFSFLLGGMTYHIVKGFVERYWFRLIRHSSFHDTGSPNLGWLGLATGLAVLRGLAVTVGVVYAVSSTFSILVAIVFVMDIASAILCCATDDALYQSVS